MEQQSPPSRALQLWLLTYILFTTSFSHALRINLTHIDTMENLTTSELLRRTVERTKHRISTLTTTTNLNNNNKARVAVHPIDGEYIIDLAIGSPPVRIPAVLDTGSDLTWTQCHPCNQCYNRALPLFDPSHSLTFSHLSCSTNLCKSLTTHTCSTSDSCEYYLSYTYNDDRLTHGTLSMDTITLGSTKFNRVGFGCGHGNTFASGYVGLGHGNLSLTSQLGFTKFSYCFTPLASSETSHLLIGSRADPNPVGLQPVKLHRSSNNPSGYYLHMRAVTVGSTHLTIGSMNDYGDGALVLDSGASISALDYKLYEPVIDAFRSQTKISVADGSAVGLDLCFALPRSSHRGEARLEEMGLPKLVLHFEGVDMELPVENYMGLHVDEGLVCLMMIRFGRESILGNFQQQNMHVVFDLEREEMSFVMAKCGQL